MTTLRSGVQTTQTDSEEHSSGDTISAERQVATLESKTRSTKTHTSSRRLGAKPSRHRSNPDLESPRPDSKLLDVSSQIIKKEMHDILEHVKIDLSRELEGIVNRATKREMHEALKDHSIDQTRDLNSRIRDLREDLRKDFRTEVEAVIDDRFPPESDEDEDPYEESEDESKIQDRESRSTEIMLLEQKLNRLSMQMEVLRQRDQARIQQLEKQVHQLQEQISPPFREAKIENAGAIQTSTIAEVAQGQVDHNTRLVSQPQIFEPTPGPQDSLIESETLTHPIEDYEDLDRDRLMTKLRQRYHAFVTTQPTPQNLKPGCYVLLEDGRDPRIFNSHAQAYPQLKGRYDVFGCTYYGDVGQPLRVNTSAMGGFCGNPDPRLFFNDQTPYEYNYGYLQMRLRFEPNKPPEKPPSVSLDRVMHRQQHNAKVQEYSAAQSEIQKMRKYVKTDQDGQYIEIKIMVDTGATTSLGPQSVLSNLRLTTSASEHKLYAYDGRGSEADIVNVELELVDQSPSTPKVRIPIEMCCRVPMRYEEGIKKWVRTSPIQHPEDKITAEIEFSKEWILGHNYLRYFQHVWTANSYIDLRVIPEYLHEDRRFNADGNYEHEAYKDREHRMRLCK